MKRGRELPDSFFNKRQLEIGTRVEMEHTDIREEAKATAKDHIWEFRDYYKNLPKMEKKMEGQKYRHNFEVPDVPFGFSFGAFFKTKKQALKYELPWKKRGIPTIITHNLYDRLWTVWKKASKSRSPR